jgi:hypothetical protein
MWLGTYLTNIQVSSLNIKENTFNYFLGKSIFNYLKDAALAFSNGLMIAPTVGKITAVEVTSISVEVIAFSVRATVSSVYVR